MDSFVDITSYGHGAFKVTIVAAVLIVMQILMVGGRFVSRKLRKVPLAADDYVLLTAAILTVGLCALALAFPRIGGIGAPIVITQMEELSEGKVLGQSFMAWLILYGLSIALSKCAILLLYLRVFTTSNKAFTTCVYLTGSVVVATGIANTFAALFQCSPVAYAWNKSLPGGHCIDEVAFARSMTLPNVVTGAIMLVVPLPLSWRLNLTLSARVALTATFLHGIISGFVASCARLIIFFRTNPSAFSNDTSLVWTIWTINEPANYIIAASLPTLRPLFLLLLPPPPLLLLPRHPRQPRRAKDAAVAPDAVGRSRGPWMNAVGGAVVVDGVVVVVDGDGGVGDGNGRRRAVMRAPGCEEGGWWWRLLSAETVVGV
ncbi:hypothetical protein HO173_009272 [Letharia columbiana]|uniref:Rhodopsin domain-containing protein n=1 Tax=Letharia columbiana TaxID=112416 RepID=A0A8H6FQ18_9LECA|nr:uncharacterized protein HO173_009272 [Letharia columbiana]KAF6232604.1 hypothetical protein HO173_009272 [Letharia columbiana]